VADAFAAVEVALLLLIRLADFFSEISISF